VQKIFQTFEKYTILLCQYYCGFVPLEFDIDIRKMGFIKSLVRTTNVDLQALFSCFSEDVELFDTYNTTLSETTECARHKVYTQFQHTLLVSNLIS